MNMASPVVSLENEHIQVSVVRYPDCKVILTITTLPLASKAARTHAVKTITKQVNIPGFRKGHAPENLVSQRFTSQIDREFRDILLRNALNEAIHLTKIRPMKANEGVKLLKFEPLESDSYFISVEFEAYPEVPTIDFDSLSIQEEAPKGIEEQDIENRMEQLRFSHAEWEEILDRPAALGDFVTLDVEGMEGEPFFIHKDTKFHLEEKKMPRWARSLAVGLRAGESKEGYSEAEEEDDVSSFQSKLCRITLKKIQTAKLPPLDDDLAKKAGVQNVEQLRQAIVRSLEKNARADVQNALRKQIRTQLLELFPFDLPRKQVETLREDYQKIAENAKSHFQNVAEWNQYKERLLEQGKENIRLSYLLPKILSDNHLPFPSQGEIQQRATEQMMIRYMQGDTNLTEEHLKYFSQVAESDLITEMALDFLIANCKKA
jgi:trigger factor